MMKQILSKWRESLSIFTGKELMVLLFATSKTYKKTFSLLIKHFWWLLALDMLVHSLFTSLLFFGAQSILGSEVSFDALNWGASLELLLTLLVIYSIYLSAEFFLSFFIFLSVRSSVEPKKKMYFKRYLNRVGGYSLIFILLLSGSYLFPIAGLAALFYLDTKGKFSTVFSSLKNGAKAVLYFFPVILVFLGLGFLLNLIVGLILSILLGMGASLILLGAVLFISKFIVLLALISLLANWYLKIKHTNYEFFFPSSR